MTKVSDAIGRVSVGTSQWACSLDSCRTVMMLGRNKYVETKEAFLLNAPIKEYILLTSRW